MMDALCLIIGTFETYRMIYVSGSFAFISVFMIWILYFEGEI